MKKSTSILWFLASILMIAAGIVLSETPLVKKFDKFDFIPPLILIVLGIYKLTALLF